jgi:hypothetical protein
MDFQSALLLGANFFVDILGKYTYINEKGSYGLYRSAFVHFIMEG